MSSRGKKKKSNTCSISECEKSGDIVFCPNRFTGYDMLNIQVALAMVIKDSQSQIDYFFKGKDSIMHEGEVIYKKDFQQQQADIKKLKVKVDGLIEMADVFYEEE